ncbi:hypothetical protein [Atopobium fossor]|uniref:hypothetical protein n=1 Tax=Atopobium fossor TaxID=39487 RepID=UPI00040A553A|nr:hypothetical protein [Atopobium fossor]
MKETDPAAGVFVLVEKEKTEPFAAVLFEQEAKTLARLMKCDYYIVPRFVTVLGSPVVKRVKVNVK